MKSSIKKSAKVNEHEPSTKTEEPPKVVNLKEFGQPVLETYRCRSKLMIFYKSFLAFACIFSALALVLFEICQVQLFMPLNNEDELLQIEVDETYRWLKNMTTLVWIVAVYTLVNEMMLILSGNDQIRILEAIRHRTRMELIVALTIQKQNNDRHATKFIVKNNGNPFVEGLDDEMDANEMMYHRVQGLNRKF